MTQYLLAIDQGTTSSRSIIFDRSGKVVCVAQKEFNCSYPENGWVEQEPEDIWQTVLATMRLALQQAKLTAADIAGIGISNQRETTIVWDKNTGKAIYPAIVWQDRRTAEWCKTLKVDTEILQQKTGLRLDPYFSASKIRWILDYVEGASIRAATGDLLFGTVDTFLLWHLTKGASFKTDVTNASRTLLFNIHTLEWDAELLTLFNIPKTLLAEVCACTSDFGKTASDLFDAKIPILGIAGDQQAALIGQACFEKGMSKCTYGTGGFLVLNTGKVPVLSQKNLLTTVAYKIHDQLCYALEGSFFNAGTSIKWLRDHLHLLKDTQNTAALAQAANPDSGVYFVPAFTGLGAPYWDSEARGAIVGLTRDVGINEIVRAALEAVVYQTLDLVQAIQSDYQQTLSTLRVDGGMVANEFLLHYLADMLNVTVQRSAIHETSALGVAYLVALQLGWHEIETIINAWQTDYHAAATMSATVREQRYRGWQRAVERVLSDHD